MISLRYFFIQILIWDTFVTICAHFSFVIKVYISPLRKVYTTSYNISLSGWKYNAQKMWVVLKIILQTTPKVCVIGNSRDFTVTIRHWKYAHSSVYRLELEHLIFTHFKRSRFPPLKEDLRTEWLSAFALHSKTAIFSMRTPVIFNCSAPPKKWPGITILKPTPDH